MMIYLASPYSHPDPAVMETRYVRALEHTSAFLKLRWVVYSPIVHCHELAKRTSLPTDFAFWQHYNRGMLRLASELWVLELDGWHTSVGVKGECDFANQCSIPIKQVAPWL